MSVGWVWVYVWVGYVYVHVCYLLLPFTDSEKATASWYDIVKKQIDHMKAELK